MEQGNDRTSREILLNIAKRLPRYGQLAARLAADGRISARQKAPLIGGIGYSLSPIDLIPGIIPVLGQIDDLLVMLGALRYVLEQMQPEAADEHLAAVGLTRAQIDADFRDTTLVAKRLAAAGLRGAGTLAVGGARLAGRFACRGWRTLRGPRSRPAA
jgi:uncharacterized membrane protein YkvA (DUF1232 family)